MALTLSTLTKPTNPQVVDQATGRMREEWQLYFEKLTGQLNTVVDDLSTDPTVAPLDAQYIVGAAHADLTAERVATDTATVDVDLGTAAQAKWNVLEVPGIAAAGMVARTAAATYAARTLTAPAAGVSVSNGDGVAGNPTLALANDLAALEALGSTGFAARTGSDAWAQRTLTAGAGITISNPAGIAGDPTIASFSSMERRSITDITAGDTITTADRAKRVRILTGTGTLAFSPLATLTNGFFCIIHNAGTGNVTLNPDGAETIDGLTSWILYPGGIILLQVTASDITSILLAPMQVTYNSSDTFTTPGVGTWVDIEGWGGGASGGRGALSVAGGGGGGGSYNARSVLRTALAATETVTIAAGGAARSTNVAGENGGNTTFGTLLTAFGGGAGQVIATGPGGSGGGPLSAAAGATPGQPETDNGDTGGWGNGGVSGAVGMPNFWGGGGGGGGDAATGGAGGASLKGGGGGGGGGDTTAGGAGGAATHGGGTGGAGATGAATAADGVQPGGGGGGSETGNSGAGGNGRITVRIY